MAQNTKCIDKVWTDGETKFLLNKYDEYMTTIGPFGLFKTKKEMWSQISSDMLTSLNIERSGLQVEARFKTVLKRKRKACSDGNCTGNSPQEIPFQDEFAAIESKDDSVNPPVLIGCGEEEVIEEASSSYCPKRPKRESQLIKVLKDISDRREEREKNREEQRERRHREKIDLLKKFFGAESEF